MAEIYENKDKLLILKWFPWPSINVQYSFSRNNHIDTINNGNWTEWSAIWAEIIRVISKSNERTAWVRFEITSMISDQNCTTRGSITTLLHPFHFEITQIQDLVSSNILLMQYWADKFIHFLEGKSKSFGNKSCKICHMILFVFHFPAIWLVTLNKPWNLIGCFVFSVASSLAGKMMRFKAKNGSIRE